MRTFIVVFNHSLVFLVRSNIYISIAGILLLRSTTCTLDLSTDNTSVGIDTKVWYTGRFIKALPSTAVTIGILWSFVLQDIFVFNLITKSHERLVNAHGRYIYRQLVHLVANLVDTFQLTHSDQRLNLEVLLATLGKHFLLLMIFIRLRSTFSIWCENRRRCVSLRFLLTLHNLTSLHLHSFEFFSLNLSLFCCFI